MWEKDLENIVGKGEHAGNQHVLLFPQCFLSLTIQISIFDSKLLCCLQMLSMWNQNFILWQRGKYFLSILYNTMLCLKEPIAIGKHIVRTRYLTKAFFLCFHNVFYPSKSEFLYFYHNYPCICKSFYLGKSKNVLF